MLKALKGQQFSTTTANDRWIIEFVVLDDDGELVTDVDDWTVSLYGPSSSATLSDPELIDNTYYRIVQTLDEGGNWGIAVESVAYGAMSFAAYLVYQIYGPPQLSDVRAYIGTNIPDAQVQDALDAEIAAQQKACRVPAPFPNDLRQALLRRTARNLALRKLPLQIDPAEPIDITNLIPALDKEVRRFEAPYRKLVMP